MASLNPPIAESLPGLRLYGHAVILGREALLAFRGGMHLNYEVGMLEVPYGTCQISNNLQHQVTVPTVGRFQAEGNAYLTTERIVFCAKGPHRKQNGMLFKGFDIPLDMLSGEKFDQPILFGANNLSGIVQTNVAFAGSGEDAHGAAMATPVINSSWRLSFRNGGFGTFVRAFYAALQQRRRADPAVTAVAFQGSDAEWAAMQATEVQAVPLDPTDGTVLLTATPVQPSAPMMPEGEF